MRCSLLLWRTVPQGPGDKKWGLGRSGCETRAQIRNERLGMFCVYVCCKTRKRIEGSERATGQGEARERGLRWAT